jgi:hypothetical protein
LAVVEHQENHHFVALNRATNDSVKIYKDTIAAQTIKIKKIRIISHRPFFK